jgi:lipoprotein-anchoring transpeptidase ErfK/SrfK
VNDLARQARRPLVALLAIGAAVALALPALVSAGSGQATVQVWFLKGEQMHAIERPGSSAEDAIRQLLAGPTAAEAKEGIRTYIPAGTPLRGVSVAGGTVTVDLGEKLIQGRAADTLLARLSQVVHTLTGPEGAKRVKLLIKGGTPLGIFPGVATAEPLTVAYLETPNVPTPSQPIPDGIPVKESVRAMQERLVELGYLLPGDVDGQNGPATQTAVLAFQKWEGLERDGVAGPQTQARLQAAKRPAPITKHGKGKRAEVLLDRQVGLAIEDDRVVRVIHISTGAPATPTPPGDFEVYDKIPKWWSVPFREWLLWAVPFNGGIAFHELSEVPPYPASHGCARESYTQAKWMYDFAEVGMPVKVLSES